MAKHKPLPRKLPPTDEDVAIMTAMSLLHPPFGVYLNAAEKVGVDNPLARFNNLLDHEIAYLMKQAPGRLRRARS